MLPTHLLTALRWSQPFLPWVCASFGLPGICLSAWLLISELDSAVLGLCLALCSLHLETFPFLLSPVWCYLFITADFLVVYPWNQSRLHRFFSAGERSVKLTELPLSSLETFRAAGFTALGWLWSPWAVWTMGWRCRCPYLTHILSYTPAQHQQEIKSPFGMCSDPHP